MKILVNLENNSYKVSINELSKLEFDGKVAVLTNAKVAGLHLKTLLAKISCDELFIITIKDGEQYKNLATLEEVLNQMFVSQLDRKSTLIAFGGGVVTDIGGFAASIYQRGIDFISVPTTLLAMVDAAVGGKTGINNAFGKNLIGSFYQPKAVYCESEFLKTLGSRELAAGMAEFIKMAACFDTDALELIESLDTNAFLKADLPSEQFSQIISKSVQLKASIVSVDERENQLRMLLNFGHSFAHIIEKQTDYKLYLHGEAVAIGIVMANALSLALGLITQSENDRIKALLEKFALPTHYKISNAEEFYNAFFLDKKSANSKINFVLLQGLGKAIIKNDISKESVIKVLESFAG